MKNFFVFSLLSIVAIFCCSTVLCKETAQEAALTIYTQRIENINKILKSKQNISVAQYDELRNDALETISALSSMKKQITEYIEHSTPAEQEQLNKTLKKVEELEIVANNILKIIDKRKIHSKWLSYTNIKIPLYEIPTLKKACYDGIKVSKDIFKRICSSGVNIVKNSTNYPFYIDWIIWIVLSVGLIPFVILFRRKVTATDIEISYLNKIKKFLSWVVTGSIYPVLVIGGFFYIGYLSHSFLFPLDEIITLYLVIAFIWISMQSTSAFINPKDYKWSLVLINKKIAQQRSNRISLFLIFLALRLWFDQINNPIEFSQYLELAAQILLSIQALFIINVTHFKKFIKFLLGLFSVAAPFLILFGLSMVADALLSGVLYTIVIYLAFKGITYSLKRLLIYIFKDSSLAFTDSKTAHKTSELIVYWIHAFFALILFFVACYGVLLAWGIDYTYLNDIVRRIFFGFKIGTRTISLINIFSAIFVFLFLFLLTRYVQGLLTKHVFPYTNFDAGLRHAFKTTTGYIGFTIAVILSIKTLGLDLSSILFILGGLSVGIGLGLQPIVTNFISGVIMLLERPIKIGDFIELGGELGIVKRINVRTTEVENFEKCSVLYPNSQVINVMVKNWTKNNRIRRIEVTIGVAYGSDTKLVENILLQCAEKSPLVLKTPNPYVVFTEFASSSLNFMLRCYLKDLDAIFSAGNELRHAIIQALAEHEIIVPFPQTNVHFDKTFIDAVAKNDS